MEHIYSDHTCRHNCARIARFRIDDPRQAIAADDWKWPVVTAVRGFPTIAADVRCRALLEDVLSCQLADVAGF